jgi:hypothetical protein
MATFEERLEAMDTLLQTFHAKMIQDSTADTHTTSNLRTKVLPRLQCVYDALTAFLNRCTDDTVDCENIDAVQVSDILLSNLPESDTELHSSIVELLRSLSPHMLPWHIHLHPRLTYTITRRFRDYPFSVDSSHRSSDEQVDGTLS